MKKKNTRKPPTFARCLETDFEVYAILSNDAEHIHKHIAIVYIEFFECFVLFNFFPVRCGQIYFSKIGTSDVCQ